MHVIDNSSAGADGVRLADANGDRLPNVAAGWEEGGLIRVYLHPGTRAARRPWPAVTVGQVSSPEDAVFADLDGDGVVDVVSCCEGQEKTVFFHWAPRERSRYLDPTAWKTEALPASKGLCQWMFCLPLTDLRGSVKGLSLDRQDGPTPVFGLHSLGFIAAESANSRTESAG